MRCLHILLLTVLVGWTNLSHAGSDVSDPDNSKVTLVVASFVNEHLAVQSALSIARQLSMPMSVVAVNIDGMTYHRVATLPVNEEVAAVTKQILKRHYPSVWSLRLS